MSINKTTILAPIIILVIAIGCSSTGQLYGIDDKNKIYTGKLSDSVFISLKQYLSTATNSQINDTIIIKYEYNNETCWDRLDQKEDAYVRSFISEHQDRVRKIQQQRQRVSIFDFREPGKNLNKIKKWDDLIIIDSSRYLFNLLFKERCTCGSSIIIMPDKRFVFLRSDAHSDAMNYTQEQIIELLAR